MKELSRRGLLAGTPLAGLALAALPGTTLAEEKPAAREGHLWIGPFPLGDWYKPRDKESPFNVGTGPSHDEILKSLNECRVYVHDKRTVDKSGKPRFGEFKDGYPCVALEGKLYHFWKIGGKEFVICVQQADCKCDVTDYDHTPPARSVWAIQIDFRYDGENWLARGTCVRGQSSPKPLVYDINGKQLPEGTRLGE